MPDDEPAGDVTVTCAGGITLPPIGAANDTGD
jgi:hypothetical protein